MVKYFRAFWNHPLFSFALNATLVTGSVVVCTFAYIPVFIFFQSEQAEKIFDTLIQVLLFFKERGL